MSINYFFKLKFYLGFWDALKIFYSRLVRKKRLKVKFIHHPFEIRYNDFADWQIFNEVILKKSYMGIYPDLNADLNILDLGGNIGLSAVSFLSEFPKASLITVEPAENNFKMLLNNTAPYGSRCNALNAAVFPTDKELFVFDSNTGTHGYRVSEVPVDNMVGPVKGISVNKIIEIFNWDTIDLIKIDIEGAELELFSANTEWLKKVKYLVIETHDKFGVEATKNVFKALEEYSYQMRVLNNNLVFKFL